MIVSIKKAAQFDQAASLFFSANLSIFQTSVILSPEHNPYPDIPVSEAIPCLRYSEVLQS